MCVKNTAVVIIYREEGRMLMAIKKKIKNESENIFCVFHVFWFPKYTVHHPHPFKRNRKKRSKERTRQGLLAANSQSSVECWIDGSMPINAVESCTVQPGPPPDWQWPYGLPQESHLNRLCQASSWQQLKTDLLCLVCVSLALLVLLWFLTARPLFLSGTACFGLRFSSFFSSKLVFISSLFSFQYHPKSSVFFAWWASNSSSVLLFLLSTISSQCSALHFCMVSWALSLQTVSLREACCLQ